ncbi:glutamyl aminopeptidase-like isoform X3 [Temnothorax longispinosus]|uniref:glutamyl aminopeptidase-like isoform X3 n=1 Tax=Temnothorax longispinosus TaxID=300112 RepID=UPI003A9A2161
MKLLQLLLDASLIFISVKAANSNDSSAEAYYCINKESMQLIQYDLKLIIYINEDDYKNTDIYGTFKSYIDEQRAKGNFIFHGQSTIFFRVTSEINTICLHVQDLKIDEAATKIIYTFDGTLSLTYKPRMHKYDESTQTVILYVDDIARYNFYNYRLVMKFIGSITDDAGGFVKTSYINNKGEKTWFIAAADFRGIGARRIFPCWDEPDLRIKFTISIMHHKNYTALSNSPINYVSTDDNGMVWTRFKTTYNISAYHVAVVLSDLDRITENIWCRRNVKKQIKFAQQIAEKATLYLKSIFHDAQFPPKVDHIVVPGFRDEGLESWGLVLYREAAVIYDDKLDSIAWQFEVARIVARKMVHQFFGNLVSQTCWSYLWLNEGIATLLSMKIVKEFVHFHLMDLLVVQFQHEALRLNDHYDMPLISEAFTPESINSLFSFTYYVKAPTFTRSLLQTVSEHTFVQGLNKYLSYQLKSIDNLTTTIDIFFDALQEVEYKPNISLKMKMNQWTKQKRYPILQVTRESPGDDVEITLQEYPDKSYPKDLYIRLTYTIQSQAYDITTEKWLTPQIPILHLTDIKKNDWIIVNVHQEHFRKILDLVLGKIRYAFIEEISKEDVFTKCLRQEAAKWACILNSSECTANASLELTKHYMHIFKQKKILPWWKEWTYCKGLMSADDISWNEVFNLEVLDNNLLEYLACTKNHTIIIGYLDLLKSGHFTEAQHRITVFHSIIARHARNKLVLDYIMLNFRDIVPREIDTFVALTDIINHLYSADQFSKVQDYVQNNFSNKMFSYIIQKINIRSSETTKHVGYFKSFLKTE